MSKSSRRYLSKGWTTQSLPYRSFPKITIGRDVPALNLRRNRRSSTASYAARRASRWSSSVRTAGSSRCSSCTESDSNNDRCSSGSSGQSRWRPHSDANRWYSNSRISSSSGSKSPFLVFARSPSNWLVVPSISSVCVSNADKIGVTLTPSWFCTFTRESQSATACSREIPSSSPSLSNSAICSDESRIRFSLFSLSKAVSSDIGGSLP